MWPAIPVVNNVRAIFLTDDASFVSPLYDTALLTHHVTIDGPIVTYTIVPYSGATIDIMVNALTNAIELVMQTASMQSLDAASRNVTTPPSPTKPAGGSSVPLFAIVCIAGIGAVFITWVVIKMLRKSTQRRRESVAVTMPRIQLRAPNPRLRTSIATPNALYEGPETFETTNPMAETSDIMEEESTSIDMSPGEIVADDVAGLEEAIQSLYEPQPDYRPTAPKIRQVHRASLDPHHSTRFQDTYAMLGLQKN